jgi:hypothetical protein
LPFAAFFFTLWRALARMKFFFRKRSFNFSGISSFSSRRRKRGATPKLRGGSWANQSHNCRSAYRNNNEAANINNTVGFRVVVSAASTLDCQSRWEGFHRVRSKRVQIAFRRCGRLHPKIKRGRAGW